MADVDIYIEDYLNLNISKTNINKNDGAIITDKPINSDAETNHFKRTSAIFDPDETGEYTIEYNNKSITVNVYDISDLSVFRLDASNINLNNGEVVNKWEDLENNTEATRDRGSPIYLKSGYNNKPTVDLSSNDTSFVFNNVLGDLNATEAEMFAVIKLKNDTSTKADGVLHYSGNDSNEHMTWDNGNYYSEIFRDTRHKISVPSNMGKNSKFVWNVSSKKDGDWISRFNNQIDYSTGSGNFDTEPQGPILGAKQNRQSGFGYISELIITDSILSSNLRDSIHSHLNNKWGSFDRIY